MPKRFTLILILLSGIFLVACDRSPTPTLEASADTNTTPETIIKEVLIEDRLIPVVSVGETPPIGNQSQSAPTGGENLGSTEESNPTDLPQSGGLPPEAFEACENLVSGDDCTAETPNGLKDGTCQEVPRGLACILAGGPGAGAPPAGDQP